MAGLNTGRHHIDMEEPQKVSCQGIAATQEEKGEQEDARDWWRAARGWQSRACESTWCSFWQRPRGEMATPAAWWQHRWQGTEVVWLPRTENFRFWARKRDDLDPFKFNLLCIFTSGFCTTPLFAWSVADIPFWHSFVLHAGILREGLLILGGIGPHLLSARLSAEQVGLVKATGAHQVAECLFSPWHLNVYVPRFRPLLWSYFLCCCFLILCPLTSLGSPLK